MILDERLSTSPSSAPALFEAAEVPKSLETDTSSEHTTGVSMFKLYIRRTRSRQNATFKKVCALHDWMRPQTDLVKNE